MAMYSHNVEFILCNCSSMFLAPYLSGLSNQVIMAYSFLAMVNVIVTHTSFKFKNKILNGMFGNSYFHYIHHEKFKYNYGLNTKLLDKIHSTELKRIEQN